MTREELIGINAGIVKAVSSSLIEYSPNVTLIIVSNPMDTMTYLVHLEKVAADTKVGGATLTGLLGTSAWYAPGAAVSGLVQAIACDQKKMFPCSTYLEGEYGLNDICIGVPVILGKNGIERIVDIPLSDAEKAKMQESAAGVTKTNGLLEL